MLDRTKPFFGHDIDNIKRLITEQSEVSMRVASDAGQRMVIAAAADIQRRLIDLHYDLMVNGKLDAGQASTYLPSVISASVCAVLPLHTAFDLVSTPLFYDIIKHAISDEIEGSKKNFIETFAK